MEHRHLAQTSAGMTDGCIGQAVETSKRRRSSCETRSPCPGARISISAPRSAAAARRGRTGGSRGSGKHRDRGTQCVGDLPGIPPVGHADDRAGRHARRAARSSRSRRCRDRCARRAAIADAASRTAPASRRQRRRARRTPPFRAMCGARPAGRSALRHRLAQQREQHQIAGRRPMEQHALAGPGRNSGEPTIGGAARQHSSHDRHARGPRRSATTNTAIIGSQIHGSTNSASPASVTRGAKGRSRKPAARPPWKANDTQPWRGVPDQHRREHQQRDQGREPGLRRRQPMPMLRGWSADRRHAPAIVRTAEYFDSSASPAHSPAPSHQRERSALQCADQAERRTPAARSPAARRAAPRCRWSRRTPARGSAAPPPTARRARRRSRRPADTSARWTARTAR